MRIAVKPATTACVSNDQSKRVTTVPIPPHAQLTACGKKDGRKRWFEHSRGVGVVEIHRGNRRTQPHFRISWRNMKGNVRVFSQTFVLPDEYEWEARDMKEVVDYDRKTVNVDWNKRRHNILSMTVHNVHRIRGRLRYRLRKTALETELLEAYKSCPGCIKRTAEGVRVRLPMKVLFASGKAKLAPAGRKLLKQFIGVLQKHVAVGRNIAVVGHTDNRPIKTSVFASNWELSTQRACAVTRFFVKSGLPARFFKAVGHSGNRPVASNDTAQGRGLNRRVELFFETRSAIGPAPRPIPPAGSGSKPRKG
jgi:flagellar motor protein MotB